MIKKINLLITIVFTSYILKAQQNDSICKIPLLIDSNSKIPLLIKFTPTNLINTLSVYQFGTEFRYINFGFSAEYGHETGDATNMKDNNFFNKYYTLRGETRFFFRKYFNNNVYKMKYLALEYFHSEQYLKFKTYSYYRDGGGAYYYTTSDGYAVSLITDGLHLKKGKIFIFDFFEVDCYFGLGFKSTKSRVLYKGYTRYEGDYWRNIFPPSQQKQGYGDKTQIRPRLTLGLKIAYNIYNIKIKK